MSGGSGMDIAPMRAREVRRFRRDLNKAGVSDRRRKELVEGAEAAFAGVSQEQNLAAAADKVREDASDIMQGARDARNRRRDVLDLAQARPGRRATVLTR